jgi:hypothetical protein
LRLASSRARFSSPMGVIAFGVAIYALIAICYHYFVVPSVNAVVPQRVMTYSVAPTAPSQPQASKPIRFVRAGRAAANVVERSAVVEQKIDSRKPVERHERPRYRPPRQVAPWPFSGFRLWL